jgi:FKBP-type peptidyl-prolyl cis-trans isomerase
MASLVVTGTILSQLPNEVEAIYENAPLSDSTRTLLPSGVSIQDIRPGYGEIVEEGKRVNIQWALKRSNGYSIDSSANNDGVPFIFVVGAKEGNRAIAGKFECVSTDFLCHLIDLNANEPTILGLDEGIRGLHVGGIRRIVIPPSLAYVEGLENGKPGPIPPDFGPKQRIQRVMNMLKDDIPGESFILDVKATRVL